MCMPDIICLYKTWQFSRAFYNNPSIKHFYLNIRSTNAVIAMRNSIYNHFLTDKPGIFFFCYKSTILT